MPDQVPRTQRDIVLAMPLRRVRMPRTQRELFGLLAHLTPERGVDHLLDQIDFIGASPRDIHQAVFGRVPDHVSAVLPPADFDPRAQFKTALLSQAFRLAILPSFLGAFAEKGRDIFIHVPKCAGTDLIFNLASRHLPLPKLLEIDEWLSEDEFLQSLGGIARAVPFYDRIFIYGHMELGDYVRVAGSRPSDKFFTVIREPLDLMLSQANYAISRLRQDPNGHDPDAAALLEVLGIPHLPEDIGSRELKELASQALLHPRIAQPNRACTYLGRGTPVSYSSAMENLVLNDVEITTTRQYERWLAERWGVDSSARHNRSETILTKNELRRLYTDALAPSIEEDQKLFDVVSWALEQTGAASVTGMQIAKLAGSWLMDGLPRSEAAARRTGTQAAGAEPDLLVVEQPQPVELYLQDAPAATPDGPRAETLMSIDFGLDGTGRAYQQEGWANTEKNFTWTNAPSAELRLPPVPSGGLCILRLVGNPFVWKDTLPFQRIEVLVNGEFLGAARVRQISVIECEVPARLLHDNEPLIVTLRLPTAARPREVSGANDDRLMAFALRHAMVLKIQAGGA